MDTIFIKGLYPKKRTGMTPDFVLGRGSINHAQMIEFCQERLAQGEEWSNYDVLQPKDETKNPYAKLNTFKKEETKEEEPF